MRRAAPSGRTVHALAAIAVVAAAVAAQDGIAYANLRWYAGLLKPSFSPTPWLAAAASLALGAAVTGALYRVLRSPDYHPDRPAALRVFAGGLAFDVLWAWLFFAGRHPSVALAAAGALAVVAAAAAWHFAAVDRRAGWLLLPWVLAATFAFLLDLSIALRNG